MAHRLFIATPLPRRSGREQPKTQVKESQAMKEQEFHAKLGELLKQIDQLPEAERERLEGLASETRQRHERMKDTVSKLQESLDYLRLSVKYLVFDLEATRRENQYLRRMLKRTNDEHGEGAD